MNEEDNNIQLYWENPIRLKNIRKNVLINNLYNIFEYCQRKYLYSVYVIVIEI